VARPPYEPYAESPSATFRWRLGVRPLSLDQWLEITDHRDTELATKAQIMATHPHTAFAVLDDGIADESHEIADAVLAHLRSHHDPTITLDTSLHPLDAAARLVQEDLVVMVERDGRLVFGGGSVCFPNRWDLRSKLGMTMAEVHDPVSLLNEQLGDTVDAFLARLTPQRPVWRLGWGVLDTDELYQPTDGTAAPRPVDAPPAAHHLRVERETLRCFPATGCVLFTIHTHLTPLMDVIDSATSAVALADALDSMPAPIAEYKQLDRTGAAIADWLRHAAITH
jgi:hypothetical protein